MRKKEKCQQITSGLAQAGADVFWLEGSAVVSPAFAKPRDVRCKRGALDEMWRK